VATNKYFPQVSVVIPIYNGEADLPDLLDCLLAQTYPRDQVEYLLVDNNSSDRTATILETTAQNSPITIHPCRETQIQSSYAARNTGIRAAIGEIIAFTDADCRPQPQWLELLVQAFIQPEIAVVAGEITALTGTTLLEQFADREDTLSQKHTLSHKFCPYGQTANLAIRRSVLLKSGLFRPYLTTGGDADICWRILSGNMGELAFAPQAIVQHRHRKTLRELTKQWRRYGSSNRYLHELHGVELMRGITLKQYIYRLIRWLIKELPLTTFKMLIGQANLLDLLKTPIGLLTARSRTQGQQDAKLPGNAKIIAWL
jgi:glycosyltransferase involved in cell wall biosynthesis